jgi:hypothetical protein
MQSVTSFEAVDYTQVPAPAPTPTPAPKIAAPAPKIAAPAPKIAGGVSIGVLLLGVLYLLRGK